MAKFNGRLEVLALSAVHQHPDNIREDLGDLTQLSGEIKELGLLNPLLVYPHPDREGDFVVQDGNRRRAAAAQAGLTEVPCVVLPEPKAERGPRADIETMLTTGRNHRPLTEAEVSKGIQGLLDLGLDITTVGKKFKMSRKEVQARAKVAQKNDGVSKAYSAGRLSLDAVQRLQELEEKSDIPNLYERAVERIEDMPNGASVETVERVIAETEVSIKKTQREAELKELDAKVGDFNIQYDASWSKVEDEMTDEEHKAAGHRYYFSYRDPEPTWYVKEKKVKPELTEAEKLDKQVQAKINGMLPIVARQRVSYIADKIRNMKADDDFAKQVIIEQVVSSSSYEDTPQMLLGKIIGNEYPEDQDFATRESWRENVGKFLSRWPVSKLALILKVISSSRAEEKISKLKGFERSSHERPGFHGGWPQVREYYELLVDQLGYELDVDEILAMEYSAKAEPERHRDYDMVPNPDEVAGADAACKVCGTEPFEPTGAEICTGCASAQER
ncbi:ParB/RepB/Spo0J family partition protein [Glutamicibacter arilaitensis]|uniref:ParB/RepB/Spo0J family partition protein n=1 Tax=Glutamicibacter arilaitensis TaxID=256701 RepID=UPI003A8E52FF